MRFWVRETDIDGFRADVAAYVPVDFWEKVREDLEAEKPVFMLAEAQMRDLHYKACDASYGWGWYNALADIAKGKADVGALFGYIARMKAPCRPARCAWSMSRITTRIRGTAPSSKRSGRR
jgi:pullulanase/glycogen debranching enzyme